MNAIAKLMRPRSVALIGASADLAKTSGRPVAYLQKHGFDGQIYPVNPRYQTIGGLACYPDVESLPEAPDVGIVLLGAERAAPCPGLERTVRIGVTQGDSRDPGTDELRHQAGRGIRLAHKFLVAKRG